MTAFSGRERSLLLAAVSAQVRYSQRLLDSAKEDDAVNNNARWCVELNALLNKVKTMEVAP